MVIKYTAEELMAIGEMVTLKECISSHNNKQEPDENHVSSSDTRHQLEPQAHGEPQDNTQDILPKLFYLQSQFQNLFVNNNRDPQHQHHHNNQHQHQHQQRQYQQSAQEPLTQSVADFFKKAQQNFHLSQTRIDPFKVRTLSEVEADLVGSNSHY